MNWLCPRCGAENPFAVCRCRACGKIAGVWFRLQDLGAARLEKRRARVPIRRRMRVSVDYQPALAKANRFTRRCARLSAAALAVPALWAGAESLRTNLPLQRAAGAMHTVSGRAAAQTDEAARLSGACVESAVRQLNLACGEADDRMNSPGLARLNLTAGAAPEQAAARLEGALAQNGITERAEADVRKIEAAVREALRGASGQIGLGYEAAGKALGKPG